MAKKKGPRFLGGLACSSSGDWTRTSDLRVMSPTSYLLLYPAVYILMLPAVATIFQFFKARSPTSGPCAERSRSILLYPAIYLFKFLLETYSFNTKLSRCRYLTLSYVEGYCSTLRCGRQIYNAFPVISKLKFNIPFSLTSIPSKIHKFDVFTLWTQSTSLYPPSCLIRSGPCLSC